MRRTKNEVGLVFIVAFLALLYFASNLQPVFLYIAGLLLILFSLTYLIPSKNNHKGETK